MQPSSAPRAAPATLIGLAGLGLLTMGLTLARSIRWPNDFAEAHWLLDYRFGFVKRGLAGQALGVVSAPFGGPSEGAIAVVAGIVLLGLCGALLWTAVQIARASDLDPAAMLAGLALLSSPYVVMAGHLTGYLDGVLVLLGFLGVLAMTARRSWLAATLASAAILVHESAVLIVLPATVLAWWCAQERRDAGTLAREALPLGAPVIVFLAVAVFGQIAPDVEDAYSARLAAAGFVGGDMHLLVPEWLRPGFVESWRANSHRFAERVAFAEMYGLILPTVLALLAYAVDAWRVPVRSVTMGLLPLAIFAPELLHVAAWDTVRIWTYAIPTAALALLAIARTSGPPRPAATSIRLLGLAAIVVNVMAMTPMLDNLADRYALTTRLLVYAPVLGVATWLFLRPDSNNAGRGGR